MKQSLLAALKHNLISRNLRRINSLLLPEERREGISILILVCVGALIEILSLAYLFFMALAVASPDRIATNVFLKHYFSLLGFQNQTAFISFLVISSLLVFILKNGLQLLILYRQSRFSFHLATELSSRQFVNILSHGQGYLKTENSALLVNKTLGVPGILAQGTLLQMIFFFSELFLLVISLFLIFLINPILFLALFLLTGPVVIFVYIRTKSALYRMGKERAGLFAFSMDKVNQAIFGFSDLMIFGKGSVFLNSFLNRQRKLNQNMIVTYFLGFLPQRIMEVMAVFSMLIMYFFARFFITDNSQIVEFSIAFIFAAFRILPSVNRTVGAIMNIQASEGNLEEFVEAGKVENILEPQPENTKGLQFGIDLKDVFFRYPGTERDVLSHINFSVKKGEKIGIVGKSGSGKTTLVKLLLRFLQESSGDIFVDGEKLSHVNKSWWRRMVGYVEQDVFILDASLAENIAFGLKPNEIDVQRVNEVLKKVSLSDLVNQLEGGIQGRIGERGGMISGGQRQRIGIARALYRNASFIIFDEATSSLDSKTEKEITTSIKDLFDGEKTFLIIAHRITTLEGCDKIIKIGDGKILGEYTYPEFLKAHKDEAADLDLSTQ